MKLHNFVNEIFDIAKENNVDVGVGTDMFLNNVYSGKARYKGAALDYAQLKPNFETLRKSRNDYDDAVHEHYVGICDFRARGKRDAAKELICNE